MKKALFVVTDSNLNNSVYQCVQGSHAVAQYLLENEDSDWNNGYLIFLQSSNLNKVIAKLEDSDLSYTIFREPDLDDKITAIAAYLDRDNKVTKLLRKVS